MAYSMDSESYQQTLALLQDLLARPSVTPNDAGCQEVLIERLSAKGFVCQTLMFEGIQNLWAVYTPPQGEQLPLMVFAGHTDVVPTGDVEKWTYPPFEPTIVDGNIYARGAGDMKSGVAGMVVAAERFLAQHPNPPYRIGFLITADEEGPADYGTKAVVEWLEQAGEQINFCIVGEPSSSQWAGDTLKVGRRGSMTGRLTVTGKQGHVAYPEKVRNPNHLLGEIIAQLSTQVWDMGNAHFPPTSFQTTDIAGGVGASNVVPHTATMTFNFRFNTEQTAEKLQARVQQIIDTILANAEIAELAPYDVELHWNVGGLPFLTQAGSLVAATQRAVRAITGKETELSTTGGTSDGRFIAPHGAQVLELGPCNHSIHQINEHIALDDLAAVVEIYQQVLVELKTEILTNS